MHALLALVLSGPPHLAGGVAPVEPSGAAEPVSLRWSAPPGCPERRQVLAEIEGYLGEGSGRTRGAPLRVEASVERLGPRRWSTTLRLGTVTRRLEAESCAVLTRAMALVTAVHVDALSTSAQTRASTARAAATGAGDGVDSELEPVEPGGPAPASASEPAVIDATRHPDTDPPKPRPSERPPSERRIDDQDERGRRGLVRVEGVASLGVLPVATGGIALAGGLSLRALRVEAGVELWPPREVTHPAMPSVTGSLLMLAGSVRPCWVPGRVGLEVPLCAGLRAGGMRGIGRRGVLAPLPAWGPWVDAVVEAAVVWSPVPALGLRLGAGAGLALTRSRFRVGGSPEPLFRVPEVNARLMAGIEVYFSRRRPPGP